MKKLTKLLMLLVVLLCIPGCFGYSAKDSEMIGQVKKVVLKTPLICPDYVDVDISLGVLRNGVGSMSTQDVDLVVTNKDTLDFLKNANANGSVVKITYDEKRVTFCTPEKFVSSASISN